MSGIVYLLHFEKPIGNPNKPKGQAQHYLGYTTNLKNRIAAHKSGNSSAIVHAFHSQGIGFVVAKTWRAPRSFERWLKNTSKNARRHCPICKQIKKERELNNGHTT